MEPRKPNHRTFRVSTHPVEQAVHPAQREHCEPHAPSATREERPQLPLGWLAAEHHFVTDDQVG